MAEIKRIPQLWVHQFLNGGTVAGVAPAGAPVVDSEESLYRGATRVFSALTNGGLFELPAALTCGWRLQRVLWNLSGAGKVDVFLRDDVAPTPFTYLVGTSTASSGMIDWRDEYPLVPPGWAVQVVGTFGGGVLTAAGRIVVEVQQGHWAGDIFTVARRLGREERVL